MIKVNEKIQVVFNVNDQIFSIEDKVADDDCESKDDWSRCNGCGDNDVKKLRNCFYCGDLNCPRCLYKTRPYPSENNTNRAKRGEICVTCNKKFLYRDAMYELMAKLEMKDITKKQYVNELGKEEYKYDQVVGALSKAKMQRRDGARRLKKEREECLRDQEDMEFQLMTVRKEKESQKKKLESNEDDIDRLTEEMESINKDINAI